MSIPWVTVFENLSPNSRSLLHVLCFMASENVPEDMLSPQESSPNVWPFLNNRDQFETAEVQLLHMSLIRLNDESGQISIDPVVQENFWDDMTLSRRKEAFRVAWRLLSAAFPKRKHLGHMYKYWSQCEENIHSILTLQMRFYELRGEGFTELQPDYVQLVCNACRYLIEVENFIEAERHLLEMIDMCENENSYLMRMVCDSISALYHRKARYVCDYKYSKMLLDLTLADKDATANDKANAHSGLGLTLTGLYNGEEALEELGKALTLVDEHSEEAKLKFNIDRFLRNRGRAYYYSGDISRAEADFDEADEWQTRMHGPETPFHGETAYMKAKIALERNDLALAFDLFSTAHTLMSREQPNKVGAMSAKYRMGYVRIRQLPDLDESDALKMEGEALSYLSDALLICQMNEPGRGDNGESARVKWEISKIMERRGLLMEAEAYRDDAEKTRDILNETGQFAKAPSAEESYDTFVQILYR